LRDKQGRPSDNIVADHHWARILEVTHGDQPEKVFELKVDSTEQAGSIGWAVFRSERLESLYGN
jgi:hypothetical protein